MRLILILILSIFTSCSSIPMDNISVKRAYQPDIRPVPNHIVDDFNYRLQDDWYFYFEKDNIEYRDNIPQGWLTDGTSVPRNIWSIFGITRDGLERGASWGHDWIYAHQGHLFLHKWRDDKWVLTKLELSREDADNIFYRSLLYLKLSPERAKLMFTGVRKFGKTAWENGDEVLILNGITTEIK